MGVCMVKRNLKDLSCAIVSMLLLLAFVGSMIYWVVDGVRNTVEQRKVREEIERIRCIEQMKKDFSFSPIKRDFEEAYEKAKTEFEDEWNRKYLSPEEYEAYKKSKELSQKLTQEIVNRVPKDIGIKAGEKIIDTLELDTVWMDKTRKKIVLSIIESLRSGISVQNDDR